MGMSAAADKKITGFQGLRGLAILLVMVSHCTWFPDKEGKGLVVCSGALGVQLFIMLSGSLAVLRYSDGENTWGDVKAIYRHKLHKYYWLHIITLVAAVPLALVAALHGGSILGIVVKIISNLLLIQSWIPLQEVYFSMNGVSWYLSLDLAFVIMLPVLLRIIQKIGRKAPFAWIAGMNLFEFVLAYAAQSYMAAGAHWIVYVCPIIRSLDFMVGGVLALCIKKEYGKECRWCGIGMYAALAVCVVLLLVSTGKEYEIFSTAVWTIPSAVLLFCIYKREAGMNLFKKPFLAAIGNISLELFLTHQLVFRYMGIVIRRLGLGMNEFWNFIMLFVALVLAAGVHCLTDSHRKDRAGGRQAEGGKHERFCG